MKLQTMPGLMPNNLGQNRTQMLFANQSVARTTIQTGFVSRSCDVPFLRRRYVLLQQLIEWRVRQDLNLQPSDPRQKTSNYS